MPRLNGKVSDVDVMFALFIANIKANLREKSTDRRAQLNIELRELIKKDYAGYLEYVGHSKAFSLEQVIGALERIRGCGDDVLKHIDSILQCSMTTLDINVRFWREYGSGGPDKKIDVDAKLCSCCVC